MTTQENNLHPKQESAIRYFADLFDKSISGFGRHIMLNMRMDHEQFCIQIKDAKNAMRTLKFERTFAFKEHLSTLIDSLHGGSENCGPYDFKSPMFNKPFTSEKHLEMFGHRFQLTIFPQNGGRVLPVGFTLLHSEAEWAIYEAQCQSEVEKTTDGIMKGCVEAPSAV
jgi:hypothetical protein